VKIPASLDFKSLGNDTSSSNILKHWYKVLVYLDSNGCIACRLNLPIWKTYIDSCQQNDINVGFLFVVQQFIGLALVITINLDLRKQFKKYSEFRMSIYNFWTHFYLVFALFKYQLNL